MNSSSFALPVGCSLLIYKPSVFGLIKRKNTLHDLLWKLLSFFKCCIYYVYDNKGNVAHKSLVIGPNFKFPFLNKGEFEIGPCYTNSKYRGNGIYPVVLRNIVESKPDSRFLMLIEERNNSSVRGVEKAGFTKVGEVVKTKWGRWIKV